MSNIFNPNSPRTQPLISPRDLLQEIPLTVKQMRFIDQKRKEVQRILNKEDSRLLLIVGPCSIHDITAAKDYATKLHELSEIVSDSFLIIMRAHCEKPRTSLGWKGFLYDPHLNGSNDVNTGIQWTRSLFSELTNMEVPIATEVLEPSSAHFFGDLVSWGCIGARTASSQIHRQAASGFPFPVAIKNNTDGNVKVAIDGVLAASESHCFLEVNDAGCNMITHTDGNPDCHVALRGGNRGPNYDKGSISEALNLLEEAGLPSRVVVDCSHDNSQRDYNKQVDVFFNVLRQAQEGNRAIRGLILESNLKAGSQEASNNKKADPAISITDPCMDFETTSRIILEGRRLIQTSTLSVANVPTH